MKRPDPRALLTAVSSAALPLALLLALGPLAPVEAHADATNLGKKGELAPLIHPDSIAALAAPPPEPAPVDEPGTVPADELRDDILVLLAELPTRVAPAAVVAAAPPNSGEVVEPAPAEPAPTAEPEPEDEPELVDLVLPTKAMGGY